MSDEDMLQMCTLLWEVSKAYDAMSDNMLIEEADEPADTLYIHHPDCDQFTCSHNCGLFLTLNSAHTQVIRVEK